MSSRSSSERVYKEEMTDEDHRKLSKVLRSVKGDVVISGYRTKLYDVLYKGWPRFDRECSTMKRSATESLWIKPSKNKQLGLFNV